MRARCTCPACSVCAGDEPKPFWDIKPSFENWIDLYCNRYMHNEQNISRLNLKFKNKMSLEFIVSNTDSNQLLYNNNVYYRVRANYWKCTRHPCRSTVATTGEAEQDSVKKVSSIGHDHHPMSRAELECKKAFTRLKKRSEEVTSEKYLVSYTAECNRLKVNSLSKYNNINCYWIL